MLKAFTSLAIVVVDSYIKGLLVIHTILVALVILAMPLAILLIMVALVVLAMILIKGNDNLDVAILVKQALLLLLTYMDMVITMGAHNY